VILKRSIQILFLLIVLNTIDVRADDICRYKADPALGDLKTWSDLHLWYVRYPQCDDGYFAEGLSDFVVATLAKHWDTLALLKAEIEKDKSFEKFVLKHIDATTDENDLAAIAKNAKAKCPPSLLPLCMKIEKKVQGALGKAKEE